MDGIKLLRGARLPDGVAVVQSAEVIGLDPVGTMAHSLVLILGEERAWRGS